VQDLDVELIHTGYTYQALPAKIARNIPLLEAEWQGLGSAARVDRRLKIGAEVGLAYAHSGRWEQARDHFRGLVDEVEAEGLTGNAALQVLVNYLWVLSEMNKLPIALDTARRFSCRFSHSPGYHLYRGLVELASRDYLGSGHSFDLFPELIRAGGLDIPIPIEYTGAAYWAVRGQAYMGTTEYAAAAESFQMAMILDPERQEYVLRHQVASRMARK
jgi:tetratricopeptide (TPR) repeat protein